MSKWKKDHAAIQELYKKLYNLDKQFDFRWPRLKDDLEAYLNILLVIVNDALKKANVKRVVGHKGIVYIPDAYNKSKKKESDNGTETE